MSEQQETTTKPEDQVEEQPATEEPAAGTPRDQKAGDSSEAEKPSGAESAEQETPPQEETTAAAEEEEEDEDEGEEEPDDGVPIVLVTGASGFIATHLIKQLLEQGRYHVRGTVRNKKREDKVNNIIVSRYQVQHVGVLAAWGNNHTANLELLLKITLLEFH